ncbi:hypothetical protein GQR58_027292 [Nymphon striatum]|nr:hypothetical protein GQR58_027292 [Nymphon striatum]
MHESGVTERIRRKYRQKPKNRPSGTRQVLFFNQTTFPFFILLCGIFLGLFILTLEKLPNNFHLILCGAPRQNSLVEDGAVDHVQTNNATARDTCDSIIQLAEVGRELQTEANCPLDVAIVDEFKEEIV